jgi:Zn-dependent alcohol dehydrogenase
VNDSAGRPGQIVHAVPPLARLTFVTEGERLTLTAPPPVRALAIAAVTALVGAGLMVASRMLDLGTVVLVVGLVGLGLAVALALAALVLGARTRTDLDLGSEAVTVRRAGRVHRVPWAEIDTVTLTGPRLALVRKAGDDVVLVNPRTPTDPTFTALLAALGRRLDADRGYRTP